MMPSYPNHKQRAFLEEAGGHLGQSKMHKALKDEYVIRKEIFIIHITPEPLRIIR
jgi:hypothetical protein